jgi:protein-S-isoprenylcysteine O-methyltransferase Ste14
VPLMHKFIFPAVWLAYLAYWQAMAKDVKTTLRSEPAALRLARLLSMVCAMALLSLPRVPLPWANERFLPPSALYFWIGAAITAGGLLFSVWGRRHLGSNWSQAVTVKEGHELITSGPYALVRHPIYTGLLLAFLGSAVARGEWRASCCSSRFRGPRAQTQVRG